MPKIFEIFGYKIDDNSQEANYHRKNAICPFMDCECDGGGNRYLSHINLSNVPELKTIYPKKELIPSGVCSLQLRVNDMPWIVCPRRLLVLGKSNIGKKKHQKFAEDLLFRYAKYRNGQTIGVWPELKMKFESNNKKFDYTFDYIIFPVGRISLQDAHIITGIDCTQLRATLERSGYTLTLIGGEYFVDDFPLKNPTIVEIMTSSTSGGNKIKRTTIPLAFEDAMLGKPHNAPGINYRQVWARMVSQLIVKSEVAIGWGGKAFWILQDRLVDYISESTALDIKVFLANRSFEVNIVSLSYGDSYKYQHNGAIELSVGNLYSGPIRPQEISSTEFCFQDMIRAPITPPLSRLISLVIKRSPTNKFVIE